ncbi:hypothetical protein B7463_g6756, partial [Scytalidium lignicola]
MVIEPHWKGDGSVEEVEVLDAIRQTLELSTTANSEPVINIITATPVLRSNSVDRSSETSPSIQPVNQRSSPVWETLGSGEQSQSVPTLLLAPEMARSRRYSSPSPQHRYIRSLSNLDIQIDTGHSHTQASNGSIGSTAINPLPQPTHKHQDHTLDQTSIIPSFKLSQVQLPIRPRANLTARPGHLRRHSNPSRIEKLENNGQIEAPAKNITAGFKIPTSTFTLCVPIPGRKSFEAPDQVELSTSDTSQILHTSPDTSFQVRPPVITVSQPTIASQTQFLEADWEDSDWSDYLSPDNLEGDLSRRKTPYRQGSKDDMEIGKTASATAIAASASTSLNASTTATSRVDSNPIPSSSFAVDDLIREEILKRVSKEGFIYILKAPEYFRQNFPNEKPLLKIGMTMNVKTRINNLKRTCNLFDLEQVPDPNYKRIHTYWKVEQLVHIELRNFQKILKCTKCGNKGSRNTEHEEWFEVSEEVALRSVDRWRRFIAQNPYDENGGLKDFWSQRLAHRNMGVLPKWDDAEGREERWTKWLDEAIKQMPGGESADPVQ